MKKIAVVYSDYYPEITQNLLNDFKEKMGEGFEFEMIEVFGSAEIPLAVSRLDIDTYEAIAVFGCVLEGETYHHELINNFVFDSLYKMSLEKNFVLGYGILNVRNMEQAVARAQKGHRANRGIEAAKAILALI